MSAIVFEGAVILLLLLLNGVFAMSEIAVVSARKTRLQQRAEEGDRSAAVAYPAAPPSVPASIHGRRRPMARNVYRSISGA